MAGRWSCVVVAAFLLNTASFPGNDLVLGLDNGLALMPPSMSVFGASN